MEDVLLLFVGWISGLASCAVGYAVYWFRHPEEIIPEPPEEPESALKRYQAYKDR